jgi:hypothetical protein
VKLDHAVARLALAVSAVIHLYFGALFALDPLPWMQSLHLAAQSLAGVTEMRAFYGGLMLALGSLFAVACAVRGTLYPGLVLMTATYLGAALVRGVALATIRVDDPLMHQLLWIEVVGALVGMFCLWRRVR